jgi:hypothetical protein
MIFHLINNKNILALLVVGGYLSYNEYAVGL